MDTQTTTKLGAEDRASSTVPAPNATAAACGGRAAPASNSAREAPDAILRKGRPLAVPKDERDAAYKAGARFDSTERAWFAPEGSDWGKLQRWEPRVDVADRWKQIEAFEMELRVAGLIAPSLTQSDFDWRPHRVPVEGGANGKRDGTFQGRFVGDKLVGWWQNWREQDEPVFFKAEGTRVDPHVYAAQRAQQKIDAALNAEQRRVAHEAAAEKARAIWSAASTHPQGKGLDYLRRKGLSERHGARFDREGLVLGLSDLDGKIWSIQRVDHEGNKLFLSGARKQACVSWIGYPIDGQPITVVEGFATGASVREALGHAVAVAFDAGNLAHVSRALRERFPGSPMAILGDNDWHTERSGKANRGVVSARGSAEAVQAAWLVPQFTTDGPHAVASTASDWNDLAAAEGLAAVRGQLAAGLPPEFAPNAKVLAQAKAAQAQATPGRGRAVRPQPEPQPQAEMAR